MSYRVNSNEIYIKTHARHSQNVVIITIVQSLSFVSLPATPWTAACQASLSLLSPEVCSDSCPLSWWCHLTFSLLFSSVQLLSHVWPFATAWTAAHQASLSITNSQSLLKLMCIKLVMPSHHLILSSPSSPAFNLSQHQGLFQWVSSLHQVAKVLELKLQHQFFQWIFRTDFL